MTDKLQFGVIGTSWMNAFHMKTINSHPQARVQAICGRDAEKARNVAQEHGVCHVHADFMELIARDDLDAVVIGAPDHLHHEMVLHAAQAGLHIVCEKPLAQTLDQATEMFQEAESSQRNNMTFFTYRWLPHSQHLKQLLRDGYVGRVLYAEFQYLYQPPPPEPVFDWHFDPELGTGMLGRVGSHIIDLAHWLLGDIDSVTAMSNRHFDHLGREATEVQQLDDTFLMAVSYTNGAMGSLNLGHSVTGDGIYISIHGDEGTLEAEIVLSQGLALRGGKAGEPLSVIAGPDDLWGETDVSQDTWSRCVQHFTTNSVGQRQFIDDILSDTRSEPSLRDGARTQAVMEAATRASQRGKPEHVPVIPALSL
jgi:predicted dehydrogenase